MEVQKNQLSRVRTFKDDLARAQGGAPEPAPAPVLAKPAAPKLPPVLVPPKPLPPLRPATKAGTEAPIIEHLKADPDIEAELSTLSKRQSPIDNERLNVMDADDVVADGTIITDQKRERFKLLPAMWEATKGWVDQGQKAWEEKKARELAAVPKVSKIENRQEIVKKAAEKSALSPKDDHREVAKRLPETFPAVAPKPSVVIKKKGPEAAPNWSHFEGQPETPISQPKPQAPKAAEVLATISTAPPVIPPPPRKTEAVPVAPKPVEIKAPIVASAPLPPAPKPEVPKAEPRFAPPPRRGFHLPAPVRYGLLALVAVGAVGGGLALTLWLLPAEGPNLVTPTPGNTILPSPGNTMVSNAKLVEIPLSSRRTDLYSTMLKTANVGDLVIFVPTRNGHEAATTDLLSVLSWDADAAFLRSLKSIEFGNHQGRFFMVAEVTSFDTAFGGLLSSEEDLSANLDPLFGTTVKESVATDQEGNSLITIPRFRDDIADNHDVRVLEDELGNERLVYGFTDKNTLIMATDRETWSAVARLAR